MLYFEIKETANNKFTVTDRMHLYAFNSLNEVADFLKTYVVTGSISDE